MLRVLRPPFEDMPFAPACSGCRGGARCQRCHVRPGTRCLAERPRELGLSSGVALLSATANEAAESDPPVSDLVSADPGQYLDPEVPAQRIATGSNHSQSDGSLGARWTRRGRLPAPCPGPSCGVRSQGSYHRTAVRVQCRAGG